MSSTSLAASADTPLASKPRAVSEPSNSSSSTNDDGALSPTSSPASRCTMTCEHFDRTMRAISSSVVLPASARVLALRSMDGGTDIPCGPTCSASGSTPEQNGLSWSSRRATRNGKPKSRAIWREWASTSPDLSLRLRNLVRLISAGGCSFLPTPVSRDYRSPGKPSHKRLTESRGQPLPETLGVRVHPELCEWLMGLPVGWTEMLPSRQLEIPTLPQWPQSSGGQ